MQKKFIISEEGKDHVLTSVGKLWCRHKCSVKAKHFTPYENDDDRLSNAPDTMPEEYFKDLLEYWNLELVQVFVYAFSAINKELSSISQL